jgi:hypothetical protein
MSQPVPQRAEQKNSERGFALLIVFLLAAAIGLMLYQQMPRVAFESERDKEQLLIDRGEQYKRAIYLFMQVNKRYPARMEDLENTNDKRFLRRRYIDPFTGKNEWRLIHTNGVALTDSLVQKPPSAAPGDPNAPSGSNPNNPGNSSSSTTTTTSPTDPNAPPPAVNAAVLQRPSDRTLPTGVPGQFGGQPFPGQQTGDPNQVGIGAGGVAFPPITLSQLQGTQQGVNGQTGVQAGQPGAFPPNGTGTPQQGFPGGIPPVQFPVPTGQQGATDPSQVQPPNTGQFQGQFQPNPVQPAGVGVPGLPGGAIPPGGAAGGANTAASLINQLLTTPRTPPPGIGPSNNNNAVGGGIAGVASTYEGPSIKSYNTRTKFNEWEFVFQNQQQTVPGQTTPGQTTPGQTTPSGNGQQTGAGQMTPFGTAPPAGTGPTTSQ